MIDRIGLDVLFRMLRGLGAVCLFVVLAAGLIVLGIVLRWMAHLSGS